MPGLCRAGPLPGLRAQAGSQAGPQAMIQARPQARPQAMPQVKDPAHALAMCPCPCLCPRRCACPCMPLPHMPLPVPVPSPCPCCDPAVALPAPHIHATLAMPRPLPLPSSHRQDSSSPPVAMHSVGRLSCPYLCSTAACEARELQRPPGRAAMAERGRHSSRASAIVNDDATLAEIAFISVVPLFAGAVDTAFAVASVARVGGSLGMI